MNISESPVGHLDSSDSSVWSVDNLDFEEDKYVIQRLEIVKRDLQH